MDILFVCFCNIVLSVCIYMLGYNAAMLKIGKVVNKILDHGRDIISMDNSDSIPYSDGLLYACNAIIEQLKGEDDK